MTQQQKLIAKALAKSKPNMNEFNRNSGDSLYYCTAKDQWWSCVNAVVNVFETSDTTFDLNEWINYTIIVSEGKV